MVNHESVLRLKESEPESVPDGNGNGETTSIKRGPRKRAADGEVSPAAKRAREKRTTELSESLSRVHMGIDFGTTYSGISFVTGHEKAKGDATVITDWGSGKNLAHQKVPTRIAYASENPTIIKDGLNRFGYRVTPKMRSCSWFKLGLDALTEQSEFDDPLMRAAVGRELMRCPEGKSFQDLATDFLRYLYDCAMEALRKEVGEAALESTSILFHITLPATWSFAARDSTRQAAIKAGFGSRPTDDIVLTDEPEAATICAIRTSISAFKGNSIIRAGACFVVIDLGGGTCDLISYKIIRLSPLQLEEACVGGGAKCGGTTIDRNLHKFMEAKFGSHFTELDSRLTGPGSEFMEAFERRKRNYDPDDADDILHLPLKMRKLDPDTKGYDHDDNTVQIKSKEYEAMVNPVIRTAFKLAEKQVAGIKAASKGPVKGFIMTGGLADSAYVHQCFVNYAKTAIKGNPEIIRPSNSWSAIARGAALSGLDKPAVLFRQSRNWIGTPVNRPFDPEKHSEEDTFINTVTGRKEAKDQMEWLVKRGARIRPTTKIDLPCIIDLSAKSNRKTARFIQPLYSCSADEAQQRCSDPGVTKIGSIPLDLTKALTEIKKSNKKAKTQKSPQQQQSSFESEVRIQITPNGDKGVLQVMAKQGRREIGKTTIEYEADPAWKGQVSGKGAK